VPAEAPAPEPFASNTAQQQTLGITARELEILALVAAASAIARSRRSFSFQKTPSRHTVPAPLTSWAQNAERRRCNWARNLALFRRNSGFSEGRETLSTAGQETGATDGLESGGTNGLETGASEGLEAALQPGWRRP